MTTYVGQHMSSPVHTIQRSKPLGEAARLCLEKDINSLIVVDEDEQFHGMVTTSDLLRRFVDDDSQSQPQVDEYVTTDVVTAFTYTELRDAADQMIEHNIHHLPVLSPDGTVHGVLSTADVMEFFSTPP